MTERQILFSAPMVIAILDDRKNQTRRVVKLQPPEECSKIRVGQYHPVKVDRNGEEYPGAEIYGAYSDEGEWGRRCPYGQPGDRLWVRESCRGEELDSGLDGVRYRADDAFIPIQNTSAASIEWLKMHTYRGHHGAPAGPWVPSIHMPRWASRILLEVTGIRVERLNDISEADAQAEGAPRSIVGAGLSHLEYRAGFQCLWESINGLDSWAANPWVWVVEFRRVTP